MHTAERNSERLDFVKYWFILKRRWLPAGTVAVGLFIVLALNVLNKPNLYQAKGQLRFILNQDGPNVIGIRGLGEALAGNDRQLASEVQYIYSRDFLLSVRSRMPVAFSKGNDQPSIDTFRNGLKIAPIKDTDVLEVSFIGDKPEFALQVVNQLMQVYVQANLQSNRSKSRTTREFIVGQIPQVRQQVFLADSALRRFKETYRVVDLTSTKSAAAGGQVKVQDQLDALATQLAEINAQLGTLRQQLGVNAQQALAVSAVGQSPAVQDVLTSVEQVQKQLKEARTRFAPDHPAILDLQDRQQELQALLRERVKASLNGKGSPGQGSSLFVGATRQGLLDSLIKYEAARTALLQQQRVLISQKNAFATQAQVIPGLEQRQRELERELGAAESTYQSLLKSLQDMQIAENQTIPTVKIIDSAVLPTVPIAPNRVLDLIRNAIGALLVGAVVAYLLEIADRRLKTVDSIQSAYPYPLLGNIPMFEVLGQEYRKLPVFAEPRSAVSEAYRMLQANLKFLRSDAAVRIITVTSAQPNEGKSVTASNLAGVLSQLGHKVLLIDADLRRPTTHQIWEISNGFGLSNVLTAIDDEDFSMLPVHVINDRLQVLTAGPIPPNPLALLDSERMASFLKAQIKNFDYVLIDTPPVTVSADPLVVSRFTDGILLVARPEILEKGSSRLVRSSLEQSGVNVLGMVVNGVILKNESYSYYYYSKNYYLESETDTIEIKNTNTKNVKIKD